MDLAQNLVNAAPWLATEQIVEQCVANVVVPVCTADGLK
jgi:hypothetical protein